MIDYAFPKLSRAGPFLQRRHQAWGVWSRSVMVYGMTSCPRRIHGSSTSRYDLARYPGRHTAIDSFGRDAESTLQHQSQNRSQVAQPGVCRGRKDGAKTPAQHLSLFAGPPIYRWMTACLRFSVLSRT